MFLSKKPLVLLSLVIFFLSLSELIDGVTLMDENGNGVIKSQVS